MFSLGFNRLFPSFGRILLALRVNARREFGIGKGFYKALVLIISSIFITSDAFAARATLSWDNNIEADLSGYRLHIGNKSRNYFVVTPVGKTTEVTLDDLIPGRTYYFALSAFDSEGNESEFSNEVSLLVPAVTPLPTTPFPSPSLIPSLSPTSSISPSSSPTPSSSPIPSSSQSPAPSPTSSPSLSPSQSISASPSSSPEPIVKIAFSWKRNQESNIRGYKLFIGTRSRKYVTPIDVGNRTSKTISGLSKGKRYYVAVTAYDADGKESGYSEEVSFTAGVSLPVPSGTPRVNPSPTANFPDFDRDGIPDDLEIDYGTNPRRSDTDNDGVSDGQEVTDGSDPLDRGSLKETLSNQFCVEWNSFLGGMWNILELINTSSSNLSADVNVHDLQGNIFKRYRVNNILANGQSDVLVHDFTKERANSYGQVCVSYKGIPGALDGRMVYYRPNNATVANGFDFALAFPFSNGRMGEQVVAFNTYQPSLRASDASNLVANWIQLTNLDKASQRGTVYFYSGAGELLSTQQIVMQAGARVDISAHRFGPSQTGVVRWKPQKLSSRFLMRNVRYFYNNRGEREEFASAAQSEGKAGTEKAIYLPFDTRKRNSIIEIAGTSPNFTYAKVELFSQKGLRLKTIQVELPAFATKHVFINPLVNGTLAGFAVVDAEHSVVAQSVQYEYFNDGGLSYLQIIQGEEPLGILLRGSYNTFISHRSELWLVNAGKSRSTANISMRNVRGDWRMRGREYALPSRSMKLLLLNDFEKPDVYGSLTLQGADKKFIAWVVRRKEGQYALPTMLR